MLRAETKQEEILLPHPFNLYPFQEQLLRVLYPPTLITRSPTMLLKQFQESYFRLSKLGVLVGGHFSTADTE